jgi:hypothetical protein
VPSVKQSRVIPTIAWLGVRIEPIEPRLNFMFNSLEFKRDAKVVFGIKLRSKPIPPIHESRNLARSEIEDVLGYGHVMHLLEDVGHSQRPICI